MQQVSVRPSFFEVYAAQHLSAALRPAIRFVLEVLSVRHPRLMRLANRSDEVFSAVMLLLETSHLYRHSALLAESFYALRRSSSASFAPTITAKPLQARSIAVTLVLSVVFPYCRVKLDEWYADATGGAAAALFPEGFDFSQQNETLDWSAPSRSTPSTRTPISRRLPCPWLMKRLLRYPRTVFRLFQALRAHVEGPAFRAQALRWYPRMFAILEMSNLLLNILYLYGHSRYFSLSLALQGIVLRRTTPDDFLKLSAMRMQRHSGESELSPSRLLASITDRVLAVLKVGFFASIFAFRFLQYYYAAEASAPRESGPVTPAPDTLEPAPGIDRDSAQASGRCPLCHTTRTNPTACVRLLTHQVLSVSLEVMSNGRDFGYIHHQTGNIRLCFLLFVHCESPSKNSEVPGNNGPYDDR